MRNKSWVPGAVPNSIVGLGDDAPHVPIHLIKRREFSS